jgi:hypothetical protein
MPGTFNEDIVYIGKMILITWIVLSLAIIYNGKVLEGLVLFSFSVHIILGWLLNKKYKVPDEFINSFKFGFTNKNRNIGLFLMIILFLSSLWFIFRAITIIQHSFNNYGSLKPSYYFDIVIAAIIGGLLGIVLLCIYYYSRPAKSRSKKKLI